MKYLMLSPRWRKAARDLSANKTRTLLVVLSLAIGIFTVSLLINSQSMLRADFDREFAAVNPASATLTIPQGFDEDFVKAIRKMPAIQDADGRNVVTVRLQVAPDRWINLDLFAFRDFRDIRIDKVQPERGAWPPAKGEILLDKTSLNLSDLKNLTDLKGLAVGEALPIKTVNGDEHTLKLAGLAFDFNRTPSPGTGRAYGYITLDTLEQIGEPRAMNKLSIVVAPVSRKLDKEYILYVAELVKKQVEDSGRTVYAIGVPDPGKHPLGDALDAIGSILGGLGSLTLVGGAFLVFNTIVALLAQQVRQIGMMKAIGARAGQIASMYLVIVLVFGLLALALATPLAILAGSAFAKFLGGFFNLTLTNIQIPVQAFALEAVIGFGVPILAALYPIFSGTRVTVREAIADHGIGNSKFKIRNWKLEIGDWKFEIRIPNFRFFPRPVLISLRNTFRRRARLVFTLLPLALSGAIFMSIANVRTALVNELDDIYAHKNYDFDISFERPYRFEKIADATSRVPGVTRVEGYRQTTDAYRTRADIRPTIVATNILARGIAPTTVMQNFALMQGRWLLPGDRDVIVVNDALLRDETDIRVGNRVRYKINGRELDLQVVGVVREKMTPSAIYMTEAYFAGMFGDVGRANNLLIQTDHRVEPRDLVKALEVQFQLAGLNVASTQTLGDQREGVEFHFSIISIPLGLLAILLAVIGGLGLMSTMSTNVMERRREIGVMRAIGASDGGVQQIFIVEGIFIGVMSWLVGIVASWLPSQLLGDQIGERFLKTPLPFTWAVEGIVIWLVLVVIVAAVSCYVPAQNAAQTSVRELLAYE